MIAPLSRPRAGTQRALAAATLAALALLAGCGSTGGGTHTGENSAAPAPTLTHFADALRSLPCPAKNLVLRSGQTYSPAAIRRARRRDVFHVHEVDRTLVPPVNWLQDPYNSKSFRGRLADLDWLDLLFYDYRHNGDVGALKQARDLVVDWVRNQPRGGGGTSDQAWQGKSAGDRVLNIAYLTRAGACEGILSNAQVRLLGSSIAEHAAVLEDPSFYDATNHGLYMNLSLDLLAQQFPDLPEASGWRRLSVRRYERTFRQQIVPKEGFWEEHSAGYQILLTKLLAKSLKVPGFDSPFLERELQRMRRTDGWLVEPDGMIPQFGYSDLVNAPDFAQREARHDNGMLSLLRTGLAVVKQPGSYLSVIAMFHNLAHKQADDLSFDLFDGGLRVVSDSGLYNKDRNRYYEFASSPAAHSTLTVDGEPFPLDESHAYGSGLVASGQGDGWYAILGRNPLLTDQGVDHTRLFLYKPGEALIVADRVRSDSEHTYRRHFQLGPEVKLDPSPCAGRGEACGRKPLRLGGPGFQGSLASWSSVGNEGIASVRGQLHPLRGFVFPSFRTKVPRWTVTYESKASDADYATAFDLAGTGLTAKVSGFTPSSATVRLEGGGRTPVTLEVRRDGSSLAVRETH